MLARMISGVTRVCGKAQGYLGLPVRDGMHGDVPAMKTSWEPTPKELEVLKAGGSVVVTILGTVPPPMLVEVEEVA